MNVRIKELALKAGLKINADGEISPSYFGSVDVGYKKFAELIVRECIAICQDTDGEDNIDARSGRQDCAVEIKEHFGVE